MKIVIDHDLKESLKPDLDRLNRALERRAKGSDGFLGDLLKYVLIGSGKRVRPALVFTAAKLGNARPEHVNAIAEAVEMIHLATLIHDDVIDHAALRRGRKTVDTAFGVDTAVLLGDNVYTVAFEIAASVGNPEIMKLLARATAVTCAGEIEQLKNRFRFDLDEESYFSFIRKKTATLFGASARCGGILAGQPPEALSSLESFGENLGIAFQITDDLLDLTGQESVVGKTLRTDVMNGKMTLPLIHFRDHVMSASQMKEKFGHIEHPNGQITELVGRMKTAGSIEYAETAARRHVENALRALDVLPTGKARDVLSALAEMLLLRKA